MKPFINLLIILSLIVGLMDIYGNLFSAQKHIGVDSFIVLTSTLICCSVIRLFKKELSLWKWTKTLLVILFATGLLVSIGLTLLDTITPANYVYSLFQINYQRVFALSFFSGTLILLSQTNTWFLTYKNRLIFLGAPIITGIFFIVSLFPFNVLVELNREDHIVEYIQFIVLFTAFFFAAKTSLAFFKKKEYLLSSIFCLLMVGLLLVTGDEISWGQRLIGIQTPENLSKQNLQNEITWHNLVQLGDVPTLSYIALGVFGSFSWVFSRYIRSKKLLLFVVPNVLFFYFFIPLLFNIRFFIGAHQLGVWAEPSELLLYMGTAIYFYLIDDSILINKTFKKKRK